MNRRKNMVLNLRSKLNQMASTFNMYNIANRDNLMGPETKLDAMSRTIDLDKHRPRRSSTANNEIPRRGSQEVGGNNHKHKENNLIKFF
ncbi:hypothetical protein HRI_000449400 [Hibiscus trionum]|uniref:Uncharacterized protein n=1 Tax=Hibiscus trionum TaxID=183268 RepID=A0A9W7GZQ3_HIBTR|nr:hypothetical protein HRI_000449400 [Hibiscus trionum]